MAAVICAVCAFVFFLWALPASAEPGLSLPDEGEIRWTYSFAPPAKDSLTPLEVVFLVGPTLPSSHIDLTSWSIDLDARLVARVDSLDYATYRAFRDHNGVTESWNKTVRELLRKTESERRGGLELGLALPSAVTSIVGEGGAGLKVSGYR